jgi:hypothetical protein
MPIGRLVLEDCHPTVTWLTAVRDVVEQVEVEQTAAGVIVVL